MKRGADRHHRTEGQVTGGEATLSGADTPFLAQSLTQELTADTAQLAHKSYSHGKAMDAYRQVERSAMRGQPEVFMFGLEMRVDRSV